MEEQWKEELPVRHDGPRHELALVPTSAQFEDLLTAASGVPGLQDLRKLVATWQAIAEQWDVAKDGVVNLAIYRLQVERALGVQLAQTVRRGGVGSKWHDATSKRGGASRGLPEGINKDQSRRYKALAGLPDKVFADYIAKARTNRKEPTCAGARRLATEGAAKPVAKRRAGATKRQAVGVGLPDHVLAAVRRVMVPDVVVGKARQPVSGRCVSAAEAVVSELAGDVFISDCLDPASWLPEIARLRGVAQIRQVVAVLKAEVWADWFRLLATDGWTSCFLSGVRAPNGEGLVLAYHGDGHAEFCAAAERVGVVHQ